MATSKNLVFLGLLLIVQSFLVTCWQVDYDKQSCAVVYSDKNFTGISLSVENTKSFGDLIATQLENSPNPQEHDHKQNHWKNKIESIQIDENCMLEACTQPVFEGQCKWIKEDSISVPKELNRKISSVRCACTEPDCAKPKCASVKLRRHECGRAFIEYGCATCRHVYLTLKKGEHRYIGKLDKEIKSLFVKKGCNFTSYDETDFEGEEFTVGSGFYEDWPYKLSSYTCNCNTKEEYVKGDKKPDREKAPVMVDVPLTSDDVVEMEYANYTRHKGLLASLTSLRHRRSSRNAYILVVGMTGSGKSATINFLFDNKVATVGNQTSTTKLIHEYHIPVPLEELGIRNSELVIIDTPGLGDTDGLEQDAKFLATLEDFFIKHEDLHNKIPNIVLIFGKFPDNRLRGKASNFVKTLRGIDLLKDRLFDTRFSNSIFVLTHYMGVTKRIQKNPWSKIKTFRDTIEEFTLLPKPTSICVAENEPVDQELPMVNGYYLLPNGEYYPQNLFKKIQEVTTSGGDPIGEAIIRNAFKAPEELIISEIQHPLQTSNSSRVDYFYNILDSADLDSSTTEVSNLTRIAYEALPKETTKNEQKNALSQLQRSLNVRNIFTLNDVPKSTVDILKLLNGIRRTNATLTTVEHALGIKTPEITIPILVGSCYDILRDSVLDISPFEHQVNNPSDIGYLLPNTVTLKMVNKPQQIFFLYESKKEYLTARLKNLRISGNIDPERLYGSLRPGFNILSLSTETNETFDMSLTALREHRIFEIILNDKPHLKPEFIKEVEKIGDFNQTDHENVIAWRSFFAKYGTHVVQSAFGGGAIEVHLKNVANKNETVDRDKITEAMGRTLKFLFRFVDDMYIGRNTDMTRFSSQRNIKYNLFFTGGDFNLAAPDFSKFDVVGIMGRLNNWDDSLRYQPTMLQSYMTLVPLSQFLVKTHSELSKKISTASAAFLNASLVYVPPPPPPPAPPREDTKKIEELTKTFNEQLNKLIKLNEAEKANFTEFTAKLLEELRQERLDFAQRLKESRRKTLEDIALSCFWEDQDLKGDNLCGALAHSCVNYRMAKGPKSVNTYDACILIYPGTSCKGTSYAHRSNELNNTMMPFEVNGVYFSAKICEAQSQQGPSS